MKLSLHNLIEIKSGLSNKRIFRKYEDKFSKIIIGFSNDEKEFFNFLNTYNILKKTNVSIPKIYDVYLKEYIIVMEDFGNNTFDTLLDDNELYNLLKLSIDNLIYIQNSLTSEDITKLEMYSYAKFKIEISELIEYYIPFRKINNFPTNLFYEYWEDIFKSQRFQFESFVHKDYEFINLILIDKNIKHLRCGIIDFQSAFRGFIGWDLFTILENPRIYFTRKYNEELIKYFYENTNINLKFSTFINQYYLLNLGRHTRLLGRWIKLYNVNNNPIYLQFLDVTQKRISATLNHIQSQKIKEFYKKYISNNV